MKPLLPLTFTLSLLALPGMAQTVAPLPAPAEAADLTDLEEDAPDTVVIIVEDDDDTDAGEESNFVPPSEVVCLDDLVLDDTGSCVLPD